MLDKLNFKNMRLRNKLILLLLVPVLALLYMSGAALFGMQTLTADKAELYSSSSLTLNADRDMHQALIAANQLLIYDPQSEAYAGAMDSLNENVGQIKDRMGNVEELVNRVDELKQYKQQGS